VRQSAGMASNSSPSMELALRAPQSEAFMIDFAMKLQQLSLEVLRNRHSGIPLPELVDRHLGLEFLSTAGLSRISAAESSRSVANTSRYIAVDQLL
jgi:hypothetical protein